MVDGSSSGTDDPRTRAGRSARRPVARGALSATLLAALLGTGLIAAAGVKSANDGTTAQRAASRYSPPPFPSPSPRATGPLVVVIGDDVAAPSGEADGWPARVAAEIGGRVEVAASEGAGYTVAGTNGSTFEGAASAVPTAADVVVFIGGGADAAARRSELAKAATSAFATAAKRSPVAQILVVGPLSDGGATAAQIESVSSALRGAARRSGLDFADPGSAGWLPSKDRGGAGATLSAADEAAVAARVERMIRAVRS